MKKILTLAAVAVMAAGVLTSCGKKGGNYTAEEQAFGDSLSTALGTFAGAQQQSMLDRMKSTDSVAYAKFKKESLLRGIQAVLDADTADQAYIQGLQMGMQLMQPIVGITKDAGVPMNAEKVIAAFKETFMKDSVDMGAAYGQWSVLVQRVQQQMQERAEKAKAESPEAKKNLADGQAYAAKMAGTEGYAKTESGLVYKIDNAGSGAKVQPSDRVKIRYVGKKIDGTIFDQTRDEPYTSGASAFVPGFNEALALLAKGGKATVVIPAELAYGVNGAGSAVGPNETLIFDIEVVDVTPAPAPAPSKAPAGTPAAAK